MSENFSKERIIKNSLLLYVRMLAEASVFVRVLYQVYCHREFDEAYQCPFIEVCPKLSAYTY